MKTGFDLRWPRLAGLAAAMLATASAAAAYDVNAAAAAFNADRAAMKSSAPVLGGWSGADSKVDDFSIERVMDEAAWKAVWARHAPGAKAPDLDFSKAMVIAIFAGAADTGVVPKISLDSVEIGGEVELTTMNYVNDVITHERGNLYVFVVLQRSLKAVRVFARSYGLERAPQEETVLLKSFAAIAPPKP